MSGKGRKSMCPWFTCEKCECILLQKDALQHEANCPSAITNWEQSFIANETLYSFIEIYEKPCNVSEMEGNNLVFLSQTVLELCKIAIGDPVIVLTKKNSVIKIAWPIDDKSLFSVCMTRQACLINDLHLHESVQIVKLDTTNLQIAEEVEVEQIGKKFPVEAAEMRLLLKNYNENRIFCVNNRVSIPYYGRKISFRITKIKSSKNQESVINIPFASTLEQSLEQMNLNDPKIYYKTLYYTKWTILMEDSGPKHHRQKPRIIDIGGYDDLIKDLRQVLDISLGKYGTLDSFIVSKGILLYGVPGVGKTIIVDALLSEYAVEVFNYNEVLSKSIGETEKGLRELFKQVESRSKTEACVILMEDIDTLCPRKFNSTSDERRLVTCLTNLMDNLQEHDSAVVILATTSRIENVDNALRKPGRLDKEFEITVPTPTMRLEILRKLLSKIPNRLSDEEVEHIAFVTHGFVGADLYGLCTRAALNSLKRTRDTKEHELTMEDLNYSLTITKPSAMNEVLIEIPDVKWTDIGGQAELKLKLKQAIEWPLKHAEVFERLGIKPPRGVLMFGPPGCSKTMIAKALATESKVNFINIKGPELFSKWVGESEKAVREVFRRARQVAPAIIFIDEIDALGGERSTMGSSTNVQERVLAQLLTELDGVTALKNVTLVAATNRPDRIDKALLRPGRLDRIIYVSLPDDATRKEIFEIKLRGMPINHDVKLEDLVYLTEGYSGAEIQAICYEAAMKALEEDLNASIVTRAHFRAALSIVVPRTPASLIKMYDDYASSI